MWLYKKPDREMFLNWRGYLLGIALVALATLLKYLAQPNIITRPNSLLYILAIVSIAILYGLGPSIFVSIISVVVYLYIFREPAFVLAPASTQDIMVLIIFLIIGVIISFLASSLRYKNNEANREIAIRKQKESELSEYRNNLEDLVKQRMAELVQLNNDLLSSQEHLKQSQEIAHLGSWDLNLVNNRLYWSDEVYRIFGLKPQEFGATYEAFLDAVHPDDRIAVDTAYSGSIREGKDCYDIEHRIIRKATGEIRYVHEKCQHLKDNSGKIIRSIGMVQDITERKLLEQRLAEARDELEIKVKERTRELAESEEKYRLLIEHANEGIMVIQDQNYKLFNSKVLELCGNTREELADKNVFDMIYSEDRDMVKEQYRKRITAEEPSGSYEHRIIC
jgi:PAS domain S-box-containing protein